MDMSKMEAMLAQAKQMSAAADQQLAAVSVEGSAGGGAVRIRMSGKKEVLGVTLDPAVLGALGSSPDDLQMLEDLLRAAFNDAGRRADEAAGGSMSGMLSGLGLPEGLL
ncbi:YbaB/EbfC family nucleoid-associated protein [Acidipila sp. EB88]|uniref:YbaB/EbfC family nucleoid-associated protein n=1 Tax=Acidipila sp. EB88 TaxID=2305226 RepID=UPI000F5EFA7D|nr:YbaB/EbfC family nucleoid-associated protein [Acidipila sp. EB88]RRA49403.1 YbaB/EbfC family nucleoid-associated protein [Acidipila sp. EB88]